MRACRPRYLRVAQFPPRTLCAVLAFFFTVTAASAFPAEDVYKIGGDVTPPEVVHKEQPKYTKRAKKAKLKGTVLLTAVVDSKGILEDIQVVKSLDPDLDAEAVKTALKWRFKPAQKNGKPVAVSVTIEMNFRLCCSVL